MASSQSPNRVYFTSFDRSVNDTNTDFTITFDTPIQNAYNFEVVSATFPNLFKSFAPYETVLYFYHEDFQGGNIAIGVPISTTQAIGGTTGDPSPVVGREAYIDKRYFADGTDLAAYLTAWLQSYSTDFPASTTGLCPFYYANDDPSQPPTFFANEAATGVTFSNLSFTFDDLTTNGTLKMTFADATPKAVRIASVLDFGSLSGSIRYPSQLGYKLGYTDLIYEAFDSSGTQLVSITSANNQFQIVAFQGVNQTGFDITIAPNDYTLNGLAAAIQTGVLTQAFAPSLVTGFTCTQAGGVFSFNFGSPTSVTNYALNFLANPEYQAFKVTLGFSSSPNFTKVTAGSTITAPAAAVTSVQAPSPDEHIATDTINLIRTASVYVASSLSSGESIASAGRKDILFVIPLTAGIGDVQLYQSTLSGIVINRPPSSIRNLRVTFLDDNFQILEPLPQNAAVSVEIHFAYNEDAKASQSDRKSTNLYA